MFNFHKRFIRLLQKWGREQASEPPVKEAEQTGLPQERHGNAANNVHPQKDFLQHYLDYLENDHAYLKFKGLSASHIPAIPLDSVYIALKAIAGEGEREEQSFELAKQEQEQEKSRRLHETVAADFLETGSYQAGEASQNTIAI